MTSCAYPNADQRKALLAGMPRAARKPRQCEHIKTNGEFCGSPAMRGRLHCYFHLTLIGRRLRAERAHERAAAKSTAMAATVLDLPPLEDANSIQVALMQVVDAILHNRLDSKRAGLVLYALQTASSNLARGADFEPSPAGTVAGRYPSFEEDFQLEDSAPDLKRDEDEVEQDNNEHAAELARIEELAQAYERLGTAQEQADVRIAAQKTPEDSTEADREDLPAREDDHSFQCHPVARFLCKVVGPRAHALRESAGAATRQERDAVSQRLELRTTFDPEREKAS